MLGKVQTLVHGNLNPRRWGGGFLSDYSATWGKLLSLGMFHCVLQAHSVQPNKHIIFMSFKLLLPKQCNESTMSIIFECVWLYFDHIPRFTVNGLCSHVLLHEGLDSVCTSLFLGSYVLFLWSLLFSVLFLSLCIGTRQEWFFRVEGERILIVIIR